MHAVLYNSRFVETKQQKINVLLNNIYFLMFKLRCKIISRNIIYRNAVNKFNEIHN